MKMLWQFGEGHFLQSDQTSGEFKRALGVTVGPYVTIEIRSGQSDDQREFWTEAVKFFDGWVTAPGMERDQ
jgi:hypothetical protein